MPYVLSNAATLMGFVNMLQNEQLVRRPPTRTLARPRPSRAWAHCGSPARHVGDKPTWPNWCLLGFGLLQGLPRSVAAHQPDSARSRFPSRAF